MDEFLRERFDVGHLPQWSCPTCKRGILEVKEKLKVEETAETLNSHDHPEYDYEWVTYTIFGALNCNNSRCSETVIISGTGKYDEYSYNDDYGQYQQQFYISFKPIFIYPSLNIFNVNHSVPIQVSQMLSNSFALFFCDDNACGNRIRSTVEVMLDALNVPSVNSADNFISLVKRIESIEGIDEALKRKLNALRILGNAATHGEGKLKRKDNLDAYKLLAHVLEKLYPAMEDELNKLSESIIKNKGPIS
jgi:hypothetical protein